MPSELTWGILQFNIQHVSWMCMHETDTPNHATTIQNSSSYYASLLKIYQSCSCMAHALLVCVLLSKQCQICSIGKQPAGCFHNAFSLPTKPIVPLNDISRKNPEQDYLSSCKILPNQNLNPICKLFNW